MNRYTEEAERAMKRAAEQERLPTTLEEGILRAVRDSPTEASRPPARATWAVCATALAACLVLAAGAWWAYHTSPPTAGAHAKDTAPAMVPISDLNPAVLISTAPAREEWARMEDDVRRAADFLLARLDGGPHMIADQ